MHKRHGQMHKCTNDILTAALDIEPCNSSVDVLGGGHVGVDANVYYTCTNDILTAALYIKPCYSSVDMLGSGHVGVDAKTEYS